MIEKLRDKYETSNVYVAQNDGKYIKDVSNNDKVTFFNKYKLMPIYENDYSNYKEYMEDTKIEESASVTHLDATKPSIIVFESSQKNSADKHELAFAELHKFIDNVLYDYKYISGSIPKINLIGHSRGGILNMMYANEHPQVVDSILSVGTPYKGSDSGALISKLGINNVSINNESARDIINATLQSELKANWELAYAGNPNIKAYALGSVMNINLIPNIIEVFKATDPNNQSMQKVIGIMSDLVNDILSYPLLANGIINTLNITQSVIAKVVDMFKDLDVGEISDMVYKVVDNFMLANNSERCFEYKRNVFTTIFEDDGMVDLDSQMANGFSGFQRFSKMYDHNYQYLDRLTSGKLMAGHNLESRDPELIEYIIDRISLEKSQSMFDAKRIGNSIEIGGIRHNAEIIGDINIPDKINGLPVTAIGDNAFNNLQGRFNSVRTLRIPATVNSIGRNALAGLNLREITTEGNTNFAVENGAFVCLTQERLMCYLAGSEATEYVVNDNVTDIEEYVFYGAKNLKKVTLPTGIITIGAGAFMNSGLETIVYGGDGLLFAGSQAFENTPYFDTASGFLTLGKILIRYGGMATNLAATDFPSNINAIGDSAFINSTVQNIVLPRAVTDLHSYAFRGAYNLQKITLNENITRISVGAFDNCYGLETVFLNFFNTDKIQAGVFYHCGDFKIEVPKCYEQDFKNCENLAYVKNSIGSHMTTVVFESNGGSNVSDMTGIAYYDKLPEMPLPTKEGYDFMGWYCDRDNIFYYYKDKTWDNSADTTILYAQWQPKTYLINYYVDGGNNDIENAICYTIEDEIVLKAPTKEGYTFDGWYDNANFEGQAVSVFSGSIGDKNLYAKFVANTYFAALDYMGGTPGVESVSVKFGESFVLPIPIRDGYVFEGWADNSDLRYALGSGLGMFNWHDCSDIQLFAQWRVKQFELKVTAQTCELWLGVDGLSEYKVLIDFGSEISLDNIYFQFKKSLYGYLEGKIFSHFEMNGVILEENQIFSVRNIGSDGAIFIITPVWILETHKLEFSLGISGVEYNKEIIAQYGAAISLPVPLATLLKGHHFIGWYPIYSQTRFDFDVMPDVTNIKDINNEQQRLQYQSNGVLQLQAKWEANTYILSFDSAGGSHVNPINVTYYGNGFFNSLPKYVIKTGYQFRGWKLNGQTLDEYSRYDMTDSATAVALWTTIEYTITYELNGGQLSEPIQKYNIETPDITLQTPIKFGYRFNAWTLDDIAKAKIECGSYGNIVLKAGWKGVVRTISSGGTYTINDGDVVIADVSAVDKDAFVLINIGSTVEEITFVGEKVFKNFSIRVDSASTDLIIRLKDFSITGNDNKAALYSEDRNLVLDIHVSCGLYGGRVLGAADKGIVVCKNITINGDMLSIAGGCAGMTDSYRNGLNGMAGIYAEGKVEINNKFLAVMGGNGASGRAGKDGKSFAGDTKVKAGIGNVGANGADAGHGQDGGNGGDGGTAIRSTFGIEVATNTQLLLFGGNGGDGEKGGNGGSGGNGGEGGDAKWFGPSAKAGGKGGNAGKGGDGGNGGNKGSAYKAPKITHITFSTDGTVGKGAACGVNGSTGSGGLGGLTLANKRANSGGSGSGQTDPVAGKMGQ